MVHWCSFFSICFESKKVVRAKTASYISHVNSQLDSLVKKSLDLKNSLLAAPRRSQLFCSFKKKTSLTEIVQILGHVSSEIASTREHGPQANVSLTIMTCRVPELK